MNYQPTLAFARQLDRNDPLRSCRRQFYFPKHKGKNVLCLCGNSPGNLLPAEKPL